MEKFMSERDRAEEPTRAYPDEFIRQLNVVKTLEMGVQAAAEAARNGKDPLPVLEKFQQIATDIEQSPIRP